jgi:hypothetical protein
MTDKQQLMEMINYAIEQDYNYIFMELLIGDSPTTELIINPIVNAELKANYINETYDDDLINNNARHISIVRYGYTDHLGHLQDYLLKEDTKNGD